MRKVRIFREYDMGDLERCINDFIKDKEVVDIKISSVSVPNFQTTKTLWTTAVVIYEDGPSQADKETSAQIDAAYLEVM